MLAKGNFYLFGTLFYLTVSSLLIIIHDGFFQDDALLYFNTATEDIDSLYPSLKNLNNNFIWHLWPVNFARFILHIGGNLVCIQFINSFISISIIHLISTISSRVFNEQYRKGVFLLCLFYPNFYFWNLAVFTENWLLFFLFIFIYILISEIKHKYIILGIMLGFIDYVRESSPLILLGLIFYNLIVERNTFIKFFSNLTIMILFFFLSSNSIGLIHEKLTGIRINKGVVTGYNLAMTLGSEDKMSYSLKGFEEGNIGYIKNMDNLNFRYKDSIWKKVGLEFITSHPFEYITTFPKKIIPMYINDLTYINFSFKNYNWFNLVNDYRKKVGVHKLLIKYFFLFLLNFLFWLLMVWQFYRSIWLIHRKNNIGILLIIFSILFTALPIFFTSASRYHVIGFVLLLPLCGYDINRLRNRIFKNR